jgi:hypothetical protein
MIILYRKNISTRSENFKRFDSEAGAGYLNLHFYLHFLKQTT